MNQQRTDALTAEFERLNRLPSDWRTWQAHIKEIWTRRLEGYLQHAEQVDRDAERMDFILRHGVTRRAVGGGFELIVLLPSHDGGVRDAIDAAIKGESA